MDSPKNATLFCTHPQKMEPTKKGNDRRSSLAKLSVVVLIFLLVVICAGFVVGLCLQMQRISNVEELLQGLNTTCFKCEQESHDNHIKQRARRDVSPVTIQDVKNEVQALVSSITASQICTHPDKVCLPGLPGIKGEPGLKGRRGDKGATGFQGPSVVGIKGDVGPDGYPGPKGDPGPKGQPGYKGEKGIVGVPGSPGKVGSKGPHSTAPTVNVSPSVLTVPENAPATFSCFGAGKPTPLVFWERSDSGAIVSYSGLLTFKRTRPEDTGLYVCKALNSVGLAKATAQLTLNN